MRSRFNLSNKLHYTLILLGVLVIVSFGVMAIGTSNPTKFGHTAGELDSHWKTTEGILNSISYGNIKLSQVGYLDAKGVVADSLNIDGTITVESIDADSAKFNENVNVLGSLSVHGNINMDGNINAKDIVVDGSIMLPIKNSMPTCSSNNYGELILYKAGSAYTLYACTRDGWKSLKI